MKSILFIFFIFTALTSVFSQEHKGKSEEGVSQSKTYIFKIDSAKLALKNNIASDHSKKTVAYYDNYINSLETKRAYISNDQANKLKAEEENWFQFIDNQIAEAKRSRNLLIKSNKNEN